jgi:hypothetical protein
MKRICLVILITLYVINLSAQMSVEEINHQLENRPYFSLGLDYNAKVILPDSIKRKMVNALERELPQQYIDSVLSFNEQMIEQMKKIAWQKCKDDTACFKKEYENIYNREVESTKKIFHDECYGISLVLACGSWEVKEAIPYLKKELQKEKCENRRVEIEMALAKLDDSIKQSLMEKYTLSYVLKNTQLDTINNEAHIYELKQAWPLSEGIETAMYLKSKEMLVNILDLMYIKGITVFTIGLDKIYLSYVSKMLWNIEIYSYFRKFPNYEVFEKTCTDYVDAIWDLSDKKLNKKQKKELEVLLSTEYRTKIRDQIREWIIENVNFEEK